ncbi:nucleotidyltransferase family protein [Bacteroides sp.]
MEDYSKYLITDKATIREALVALNALSHDVLVLFVMNECGQMVGTLTDGDIRRFLISKGDLNDVVELAMTKQFHYVVVGGESLKLIKDYKNKNITLIPYLDSENRILRVINLKKKRSLLPIDAVLMAGGKGERLRPLTERIPKPLLQVGNKAIIDYNIDRLISYGIENISVTVNYLKEQIEEHFLIPRDGVQVRCIREPQFLGTIGSIKFVDSFYNDVVLVMNSDLFTNIDYEDFYLHFKEHNADMSVAAIPYSVSIPYGIFELDGRNIYGVREKPTYNYYANAGIYLIKRELLDRIPNDTFYNATDFMETLIRGRMKVVRFPITGYWIDIGKHEDYKKAQDFVKHL